MEPLGVYSNLYLWPPMAPYSRQWAQIQKLNHKSSAASVPYVWVHPSFSSSSFFPGRQARAMRSAVSGSEWPSAGKSPGTRGAPSPAAAPWNVASAQWRYSLASINADSSGVQCSAVAEDHLGQTDGFLTPPFFMVHSCWTHPIGWSSISNLFSLGIGYFCMECNTNAFVELWRSKPLNFLFLHIVYI